MVVKTVEVKVTDPKLLEEVDALKEKVRTAETIWNDLEIQNTTIRKQLANAQQQAQVGFNFLVLPVLTAVLSSAISQRYLNALILCYGNYFFASVPPTVIAEGARRADIDSASVRC